VAIQKGGIILAIEAAGLITVIHLIEAYLLNPRIMGSVMHMHPLLVLVLLFIFEHFFGVWGLLLAVPGFHYIFYQVILGRKPSWMKDDNGAVLSRAGGGGGEEPVEAVADADPKKDPGPSHSGTEDEPSPGQQ
jgi:hypothetical protein